MDKLARLYCDNMRCVQLGKNPIYNARTKRIEVHNHFIKEIVLTKKIDLIPIMTKDQGAYIFTNSLGK